MKNFSKIFVAFIFVAFIAPSMTMAYGGGGGAWRSDSSIIQAPSIFNTEPLEEDDDEKEDDREDDEDREGEVLGVDTFRFNSNMSIGSKGDDVTELQNRLTAEGVYTGPITGFFGPLTRAGVVKYQKAHNITPAAGFVGPITREALNKGVSNVAAVGAALSSEQRGAIQVQIDNLLSLVKGLMAQLGNL